MQGISLIAADGFRLAATRFLPAGTPKAVIVLPSAMGVKQAFYFDFACFLAEQGFAVLTFDYRGMGDSVPEPYQRSLRGFKADLFDWAERDYNAALREARTWQADVPLLVIGHSLGGQLVGLLPDNHLVDGLIAVACGSGYWRDNAPQTRRVVWLFWYLLVPLYTRLFGYFPGKKVRKVGNLPAGVIRQWSRWCRSPHYVVDEHGVPIRAGYDKLRVPVLSLSFTDDEMMSKRSIDSLLECYRNAAIEHRIINPADVRAKRIGHFGFFRSQFRPTLWHEALCWLNERVHAAKRAQSTAQPV